MTEEIKKILDKLQDSVNYPKIDMPTFDGSDSEYIDNDTLLEPSKCKLLLNYITNLQKEKRINNDLIPCFKNREKELKKQINVLQKENENLLYEINGYLEEKEQYKEKINKLKDYKQKNEKVIEYIENKTKEINFDNDKLIDVLNILQGGDE